MAQNTQPGSDGDIIVTARRSEERLQDVPISITVMSQEKLATNNIVNMADLGQYTPSLSTNSRFGPEKSTFAIRGFVQDLNTAPSVGVYFADVPAVEPGGSTSGGNGIGVGAMFDLENVQVLKGPQGTLFGRNTTGGAVLIVPKRPTRDLEGYVEGSIGNYGMKRVQGVVNLPVSENLRIRAGVDRMTRDGYLVNHSGIGPDRLANADYVSARFSVIADLSPTLENYTIATYTNSDTNGITGRIGACSNANNVPPSYTSYSYAMDLCQQQMDRQNLRKDTLWDVESNDPHPREKIQTWQLINTTTWRASDSLTVKNIVSYQEFREYTDLSLWGDNYVSSLLPASFGVGQPLSYLVHIGTQPGMPSSSESMLSEELQLQGHALDGKLTWQAGGFMSISNPLDYHGQLSPIGVYCTDDKSLTCFGQGIVSLTHVKNWYRSHGIYAQSTYKLTDKLSLTAGLRYTWNSARQYMSEVAVMYTNHLTGAPILPPGAPVCSNPAFGGLALSSTSAWANCGVEKSVSSNAPTWLIDLEYKPSDDMMLYAKWARGYREGGVTMSNYFFETWKPEKVDTYEIGAKTSFRGAVPGYFNIAAFYNDFRNQQLQATLNSAIPAQWIGGSATVNAGKSRMMGVEVDASVTPLPGLKLDVAYAYLDTKLLALDPVANPLPSVIASIVPTAVIGGNLALSPKNRISLSGTYTLPLASSIGEISFSATFTHTDSQIATLATAPQFIPLPATDLLNLSANWKNVMGKPVDLSFFMTNVGNKAYGLNVGSGFYAFGFESLIPNEPRMFGMRLKVRF